MRNTPIKSRNILETRPGAVVHSDVAEMNDSSVGGARYFITFIDEASEHQGAGHMKTICEAAELLKLYILRLERQTDPVVKNIVLDGGKEYMKGSRELQID